MWFRRRTGGVWQEYGKAKTVFCGNGRIYETFSFHVLTKCEQEVILTSSENNRAAPLAQAAPARALAHLNNCIAKMFLRVVHVSAAPLRHAVCG
jgi:hypothetical protein